MQTDLDTLKERVVSAAKHSNVADRVQDVALESDKDEWGGDFLRILVRLRDFDEASDRDLEALLEEIERTVGEIDERYPSVRFADAE